MLSVPLCRRDGQRQRCPCPRLTRHVAAWCCPLVLQAGRKREGHTRAPRSGSSIRAVTFPRGSPALQSSRVFGNGHAGFETCSQATGKSPRGGREWGSGPEEGDLGPARQCGFTSLPGVGWAEGASLNVQRDFSRQIIALRELALVPATRCQGLGPRPRSVRGGLFTHALKVPVNTRGASWRSGLATDTGGSGTVRFMCARCSLMSEL